MNTRKSAFPRLPSAALVVLCLVIFLGLSVVWPAFAQTITPTVTTSPQASPQPKTWFTANSASLKEKMWSTAQVPDVPQQPYGRAELLQEENRRLKQRIETLEKENADLKTKLGGK